MMRHRQPPSPTGLSACRRLSQPTSLATVPGALSRPAFDPAAGASGPLGIQPTLAPPQTLSGSDAIMPTVRETLSASVTAVDLFADASVGPGLVLPPRAGTVFAASGTIAVIGPRNGPGDDLGDDLG